MNIRITPADPDYKRLRTQWEINGQPGRMIIGKQSYLCTKDNEGVIFVADGGPMGEDTYYTSVSFSKKG